MLELCDKHLELIRAKPCAVQNGNCMGRVVPAHLKPVGRNNRSKPSYRHFSTVPLCDGHHSEQEGKTQAFNEKHNTDLGLYALQLTIETLTGVEACWHKDKGQDPATTAFINRILSLYNKTCPSLPKAMKARGERKRLLQARIREHPHFGFWEGFFTKVEASDHLCGKSGPTHRYPNGWKCPGIDWLIIAGNFDKVMEDKYLNKEPLKSVRPSPPSIEKLSDDEVVARKEDAAIGMQQIMKDFKGIT